MNLVCANCAAEYRIDASKIPAKGGVITCKSCGNKIKVRPPGAEDAPIALAGTDTVPDAPPTPPEMSRAPLDPGAITLPGSAPDDDIPEADADDAIPLADSDDLVSLDDGDTPHAPAAGFDGPIDLPPTGPLDVPSASPPDGGASFAFGGPEDDLPAAVVPPPPEDDLPAAIAPPPPDANLSAAMTPPAPEDDLPEALTPPAPPADDLPMAAAGPSDWPHSETQVPLETSDLPSSADLPEAFHPFGGEGDGDFEVPTAGHGLRAPDPGDLPPLPEAELPPLDPGDLPPLPEGGLDLPEAAAPATNPTDLPAPELSGISAPNLGAQLNADDLPTPSQPSFESSLGDDLFGDTSFPESSEGGVDTSIPLDNGLPDPDAPPGYFPGGEPVDGGLDLDLGDRGPAEEETASAEGSRIGEIADDLEDTLSGVGAASHPPPDERRGTGPSEGVKKKPPLAALGALAAVVLAVVAVSFFAPDLLPFSVPWAGGNSTPELPELPQDMQADAKDAPEPPTGPKPEEPEAPALGPAPKLTASNVHALPFGQLRPAVEKYAASDGADPGLVAFGRFRLAHTFGDEEAAKALLKRAPKRINLEDDGDELALAAQLGTLILDGKSSQAKKLGERALKGPMKDAPLIEYVTGVAYAGKPPQKALKHLNRAVELDPGLVDASIARAELLFRKRGNEEEAEEALRTAVQAVPGPAIALRAARILMQNERFRAIDRIDDPLISSAQAEQMAAVDRTPFFRLLIAKNVWAGDLDAAAASAKRWSELDPRPEAFIAHARLVNANGGDPAKTLRQGLARLEDPEDKGRLLHELGRLALTNASLDEPQRIAQAETLLDEAKELPGRDALGWVKLLEGDIARARKQVPRAKAAYAASGRGRSKFVEPRLATLLIEGDGRGPNLAKLTQLEKRSDDPQVTLALADALADKGNPGGAAELYEKALWTNAAPSDALEHLVSWARSTAASGRRDQAYARLRIVQEARPKDPAVVRELVSLAQSMNRPAEAVSWYEKLLESAPDNLDYKIAYAGALNDAGKHERAITLLEELMKKAPEAKSGRSLAELGRAYMGSDEVKARQLLNEAKRLEPSAEIYTLLGRVEAKQQRFDAAMEAFQEALKLSGGRNDVRLELGLLQLRRGNPQDAVDNLKMVLRNDPSQTEAVSALGEALTAVQKYRDALQIYQRALEAGTENVDIMMKSALLQLQQLNQLPQAVKTLRDVLTLAPENAEAHYYLGYAYKDMGRSADAKRELSRFVELAPDSELVPDVQTDLKNL